MPLPIGQNVEALENLQSDFSERIIPKGSIGVVIECYQNPESYAVDFEMPDEKLIGGKAFENVIVHPHQIRAVKQ